MKLPDLICVGFAKCGTTPLWYNLDKHPDITMASRNELKGKTEMYFWNSWHYTNDGFEWYSKFFKGNKLNGEKTPSYIWSNLAFKRMKNDIPNIKLIVCMRHPAERALSNFRMNKKSGKVSGEFTFDLFKKRYGHMGKYIVPIKNNLMKYFNDEQIHFCITERMKENTVEEMNKIYDFLGIPRVDIERRKIKLIIDKNIPPGERMRIRRSESFYGVWDQYETTLKGEIRERIMAYYEKSNNELFNFLGYDIDEWKI